jgi:hypothetical protein
MKKSIESSNDNDHINKDENNNNNNNNNKDDTNLKDDIVHIHKDAAGRVLKTIRYLDNTQRLFVKPIGSESFQMQTTNNDNVCFCS